MGSAVLHRIFFADSHKLFHVQQLILYFKNYVFIYFWLWWVFVAARPFSVVVESGDYPLVAVLRLSTAVLSCCEAQALGAWVSVVVAVGSLVAASRLHSTDSIFWAHRFSCSATHGIFLDHGSFPCLLHWQVDSLPLDHQRSPTSPIVIVEKNSMVWMF